MVSVLLYINGRDKIVNNTDTYEHVMALQEQQKAKEQAVRDELDDLESDLTELWEDYYCIPYGSIYRIRIRTELPGKIERRLYILLNDGDMTEQTDAELIRVLSAMTAGIYLDGVCVRETGSTFWENSANWNMRKVEAIILSYLSRLKEEREKIFSFPAAKTSQNAGHS